MRRSLPVPLLLSVPSIVPAQSTLACPSTSLLPLTAGERGRVLSGDVFNRVRAAPSLTAEAAAGEYLADNDRYFLSRGDYGSGQLVGFDDDRMTAVSTTLALGEDGCQSIVGDARGNPGMYTRLACLVDDTVHILAASTHTRSAALVLQRNE